jgi:hypothetical protein
MSPREVTARGAEQICSIDQAEMARVGEFSYDLSVVRTENAYE